MSKDKIFNRKVINDPIYGFISINDKLIFQVLEHPYVQRLRRIQQMGMASLVYPGALHTRFSHSVGAMHLTDMAIENLRQKGFVISSEDAQAAKLAILLHDVGHGPFSHALENVFIQNMTHEEVTALILKKLNNSFGGQLATCISVFENSHNHKFLHQLISGQLDMDRMDYLTRDSFYTGVSEGIINIDRILKMLTVFNDAIAVEEKGVYSIENFIMARRLMYWQVYYHKTSLVAEHMLIQALNRSRFLIAEGNNISAPESLLYFLKNNIGKNQFINSDEAFNHFINLDDWDIHTALKQWQYAGDFVLKSLCSAIINRKLFRLEIIDAPVTASFMADKTKETALKYNISLEDAAYFTGCGEIRNNAYNPYNDKITIVDKEGEKSDITDFSQQLNLALYSKTVSKYFVYYPK